MYAAKTHILQILDGTCRPWVKVTPEINDVISLVDVCERTMIPLEHPVERETFGEREKCATSVKRWEIVREPNDRGWNFFRQVTSHLANK